MAEAIGFELVEYASRAIPGFRNRIVALRQLPRLAQRYAESDSFSGTFLFDQGLIRYVKSNGGSVAGYEGACDSRFLALDIDSEDVEAATDCARQLCMLLLDYYEASPESVIPYFSGKKGYHLMLATRMFGDIQPSEALPDVLHRVRKGLVEQARLRHPECVDFGIGHRLHLLRLPNTKHSGSGLYKVPLTLDELMHCDVDEVRQLAREPRECLFTDPSGLVPLYDTEPLPDAVDLFEQCAQSTMENERGDVGASETFLTRGDVEGFLCAAERKLYEGGVPKGYRSAMAVRLASRMRAAGYGREEAASMIESWNERNRPPLPSAETRRLTGVAYRGGQYEYGCGTGKGDAGHTERVYEACPYRDRRDCDKYRLFRAVVC